MKPRVGILISGRGSNMAAIVAAAQDPAYPATIACVLSNRPDATGLKTAAAQGIPTLCVDHKHFASREAFEDELNRQLDALDVDFVVLAGFMRVLTERFIGHWDGKLVNIHPSLLPAFPGLHTHRQALAEGVRIHGCTVHFVTPTLDHGPIIIQAAVPVLDSDDEATLAARVLRQEHLIYPQAVRWFAAGQLSLADGRVRLADEMADSAVLTAPALR